MQLAHDCRVVLDSRGDDVDGSVVVFLVEVELRSSSLGH